MRSLLLVLLLAALPCVGASDVEQMLDGVKEVAAPGAPGAVCVFGPDAFPVIAGKDGELQSAIVAASKLGKGRLVLFGHNGYFGADAVGKADTARLIVNAAKWASGKSAPRVGLLNAAGLKKGFEDAGCTVFQLTPKDWTEKIGGIDVMVGPGETAATPAQRDALKAFVENGGGYLAGTCPWGWVQVNGGKSLATEHPGNQLFKLAGLVFADGTPDKTAEGGYAVAPITPTVNANAALATLEKPVDTTVKGAKRVHAQASQTLLHALRALPPDDGILLPKIDAMLKAHAAGAVPTPTKPLKQFDHAIERLVLTRQLLEIERTPAEKTVPHPAAEFFPGPIAAATARVTRTVEVGPRIPEWHGTGLYAAPGEAITVTIPASDTKDKIAVRIGCHRDELWHLEAWRRAPKITRQWALTETKTVIANAFGGPIYIVVPDQCKLPELKVTIAGAVEAPRYILGKTTTEEWKTIRERAAPWAEMENARVVFTIPSEFIRTLDDPAPVMQFWTEFMDGTADLAAIPRNRTRPERYVSDTQISAGFMHSGYPIMMHYAEGKPCMDLQHLMTKDEPTWGYFHEMGHNHQKGEWTFGGTTEVTCNLFARYAFETLTKRPLSDQRGHKTGDFVKKLRRHLAGGASFDQWKADPFLALYMYDQLLVGFGWDTFKKVFAEYRALPAADRPKSEEQKRDQWMVRFSRATGKNLGPFFQAWGVPTSEAARKSIGELPEWMPADWPKLGAEKTEVKDGK